MAGDKKEVAFEQGNLFYTYFQKKAIRKGGGIVKCGGAGKRWGRNVVSFNFRKFYLLFPSFLLIVRKSGGVFAEIGGGCTCGTFEDAVKMCDIITANGRGYIDNSHIRIL